MCSNGLVESRTGLAECKATLEELDVSVCSDATLSNGLAFSEYGGECLVEGSTLTENLCQEVGGTYLSHTCGEIYRHTMLGLAMERKTCETAELSYVDYFNTIGCCEDSTDGIL